MKVYELYFFGGGMNNIFDVIELANLPPLKFCTVESVRVCGREQKGSYLRDVRGAVRPNNVTHPSFAMPIN